MKLTLTGWRFPTYLAKDLLMINFPQLRLLNLNFSRAIKKEVVINMLSEFFINNLCDECKIIFEPCSDATI